MFRANDWQYPLIVFVAFALYTVLLFHGTMQSKRMKDSEEARERSLTKKDYENGLAERRRTEELVRAVQNRGAPRDAKLSGPRKGLYIEVQLIREACK